MIESLRLVWSALAGAAMGIAFFGGLWWTTRKALASRNPALWFLGSMLLRTALALAVFYAVGAGHWERTLLCLLGFIAARFVVIAWTSRSINEVPRASKS